MSVTIEELEFVASKIAELRADAEEKARIKKEADAEVDKIEARMLELLEQAEKTSYDSRVGRFNVRVKESIKIPADEKSKTDFFTYLKGQGIFEQMVSVHSATLNSWYQQEMDAALGRGELEFRVPGLGEPTPRITLAFTRKK